MLRGGPGNPRHQLSKLICLIGSGMGTFKEDEYPSTAYLQYTSGSTARLGWRGDVPSERSLIFEQLMSGYF